MIIFPDIIIISEIDANILLKHPPKARVILTSGLIWFRWSSLHLLHLTLHLFLHLTVRYLQTDVESSGLSAIFRIKEIVIYRDYKRISCIVGPCSDDAPAWLIIKVWKRNKYRHFRPSGSFNRMAFLIWFTSNLHLLMQDFVQSLKNRTLDAIFSLI